ncbi:MAG: hypothetical protein KDA22_11585 [Phycisphaerales bacterium]|nr:hypothetical protein [Phycisphaerales bacterium]
MSNDPLRYAEKFTSINGGVSYTFPTDEYEYTAAQAFREALTEVIGADYAHDFIGGAAWPKAPGEESVRFVIWADSAAYADSAFDTMASTLRSIGLGKLWLVDVAGNRRWCYAKLRARPAYVVNVEQFFNMPSEATFLRLSDWYASAATTGSQALSGVPTAFTITNTGNARTGLVTFRLRSNGVNGFQDPTLTNSTNGQAVASTRDAAGADSELRIDTAAAQVRYSNDDGTTYADDYSLVTLAATQAVVGIELEPGDNSMSYSQALGTPDAVLEWEFWPAYA